MRDWTDEEWDEYIKEVNAAYWAEEEEMKLGIHPSQTDRSWKNDRHNRTDDTGHGAWSL